MRVLDGAWSGGDPSFEVLKRGDLHLVVTVVVVRTTNKQTKSFAVRYLNGGTIMGLGREPVWPSGKALGW